MAIASTHDGRRSFYLSTTNRASAAPLKRGLSRGQLMTARKDECLPFRNYALLSNCPGEDLVDRNGAMDWFCPGIGRSKRRKGRYSLYEHTPKRRFIDGQLTANIMGYLPYSLGTSPREIEAIPLVNT